MIASMNRESFECPKCQAVSYNQNDIANWYCGRCHQFVEDMRNERVRDFEHITKLHLTRKDCFTLALLELTLNRENPDARLVHGLVVNSFTGKLTEHAWCEMPGTATYEDGSTGPITIAIDHTQVDARARIIPAETLYEKTGVQQMQRFTFAEALVHAAAEGQDGPWKCSPLSDAGGAMLTFKNPTGE